MSIKRIAYKEITDKMDIQTELSSINIKFLTFTKETINKPLDIDGHTILHFACAQGIAPFVNFLLENYADPFIKDKYGLAPIHYAVIYNHPNVITKLVNEENIIKNCVTDSGDTLLHIAVLKEDLELTKILIDLDVDVNIENKSGFTPLLLASFTNQLPIINLLFGEKGEGINHANSYNYSALHIAASTGNIDNSKALITYRAEVNLKENNLQWTPLDFAKLTKNDQVVEFLKNQGALDYGTVLKAKELSFFIKTIKTTICSEKGVLEFANEQLPGLTDIGLGIAVYNRVGNINPVIKSIISASSVFGIKKIFELTHDAIKNLPICYEKEITVSLIEDVSSLNKAEKYITYNQKDTYLALGECKNIDMALKQFSELNLDWSLCKIAGDSLTEEL